MFTEYRPLRLALQAVLSCALLFSLPAAGEEKPERWIEVRSPNFTVISNGNEKQARRVAEEFEQIRAIFQTALPRANVDPGQPVVILAAKNEKTLSRLLPAYWETKGRMHPAGIFLNGPEKHYAAVRMDAEGEQPFQIIYHEYVHLLVQLNVERIPVWLNEGLAEFYSHLRLFGKEVGLGYPSGSHIQRLREEPLLPLQALLTADHRSPYYNEADKSSTFYAQSWAITHYLMIGDKGKHRKKLAEFLALLQRGTDDLTAAQQMFGDLKAFEKAIREYISLSSFYYTVMKAPADVTDASFHVRDLSPAEAAAVAGDFYVRTRRPVEARARLEEAMRLDPSLAAPRESMGMLCQTEDKIDEAMQWFSEAVQRDSKSFLAHYYHAMLAAQGMLTPERREIAERGLRRTIELNPRFAPAYSTLARFYMANEARLPEALELARKAIQLEPGVLAHHLVEANILLQMDRAAEARAVAQRILASARTPPEQLAAQALLNNIASWEAFREEKKRAEAETARYIEGVKERAAAEKEAAQTPEDPGTQPPAGNGPADTPTSPSGPVTPGEGRVANVTCSGFAMDMTLEYLGDSFTLHAANYYKIEFLTTRWQPPPNFSPCQHLKGRQVKVQYRVTSGKPYAGELISLEVRR